MNEVQVTTLLDRLGSQIDVGPAPVERVADAGSRRLRARRSAQLAGVASAVAVIAVGGLALRPDHNAAGPTASQQSTWRGAPPTEEQLLGTWRPLVLRGEDVSVRSVDEGRVVLSFAHRMRGIGWNGYDGCNGWGGWVYLGPDGSFATSNNGSTRIACYKRMPFTEVDAVLGAATVRLVHEQLVLYDKSGTPLGVFIRTKQISRPDRQVPLPGRVPAESELVVGNWLGPIGSVPSFLGSRTLKTAVTFEHDVVVAIPNASSLSWRGYDGCNWTSGYVHLTSDGRFWTTHDGTTLRGCSGPGGHQIHPVSAVDIVEAATRVRLVDRKLRFYNNAGQLLGILRPYPGVIN